MENKEKLLEEIKQTESKISQLGVELANLKAELDKPSRVEVASDGAVLEADRIEGYYITGNGYIDSKTITGPDDIKYLTTFATKEQAQDEVLRREISSYIRRRACELNDNHDWRLQFNKKQFYAGINGNYRYFPIIEYSNTNKVGVYFKKIEHAQTVIAELNAKYSADTIKRLYFTEEK